MSAVSSPTHFPITTLRLSPCGESNLQCFYDKPLGRVNDYFNEPDRLVASDYNKIVKAAVEAGIDRVLIGGAEPLLRKDISSVVKSICGCKKLNDVRFITNGIFLKDFSDSLRRSGLQHIEINLDSLNFLVYQKITRRDGLYRVLDGLQKVERLQFERIVLNVLLLRGVNDKEIVDFAIMTKDRPLDIRFIEYNPLDSSSTLTRQLHYPVYQAKKMITDFQALLPAEEGESERFQFKGGKGTLSFIAKKGGYLGYQEPKLILNSQGVLFSELPGSRNYNLVKEMAKDGVEERLIRIFHKLIAPATVTKKTSKRPTKSVRAAKSKTPSSRRAPSKRSRALTA